MNNHPSPYELDAYSLGDTHADVHVHLQSCAECTLYVDSVQQECDAVELPAFATSPAPSASAFVWLRPLAATLAAAAGLMLVLYTAAPRHESAVAETTRIKGGSMAVVLQRAGMQSRHTGALTVRPGDALRVEFSLERELDVAVAFAGDDGSWVPLGAPSHLARGTHFSEHALRFDASPTPGKLLLGSPLALEKARISRSSESLMVVTLRVDP